MQDSIEIVAREEDVKVPTIEELMKIAMAAQSRGFLRRGRVITDRSTKKNKELSKAKVKIAKASRKKNRGKK